jgi:GH25 family lysozyme M1 (1,4-beta-N-acetylmuramidase)
MPSPVIDLSHHNPTPNWAQLKAGGVVGVIHKATEGTSYVDSTLFSRAGAALQAGLKWATYHFLRPGSMPQQMAFYLNTVNPKPGERMCLDHEDSGVSLDDLKDAVECLLADTRKLQVTIYSGHVIKDQLGDRKDTYLANNTSLWIAQYTSAAAPAWPSATWPAWSLWQWTDKETVAGINQPVDGDRWNGTTETLLAWFGPAGDQPQPAPEPDPWEPAEVTITTRGAVRVSVNGVIVTAE